MARSGGLPQFYGSCTALITPFKGDKVDEAAFQKLCAWQIENGTNGLVPVGTTGESPTLSHAEHNRVVELCVEVARGKAPVIAGAGSNSTAEAIAMTQHAQKVGAQAVLSVAPYYNKPTQEGLYQHFKAIHDASDIPIIVYNIPPRSIVDISVETFARLAKLPRIVGVKDATMDLARPLRMRLALGENFIQLSGEDATAIPLMSQGGHGCISVTSNIAPKLLSEMHGAWRAGDFASVQKINDRLLPVHDAMFCETSPGPVKYAASLLGLCGPDVRLPLVQPSDASKARIRSVMEKAGLLG
ncbi:MAG: 4-hydroxy-tetrahydrodipicolinate synthase [Alphaproteobacteria bacterium]|nr:4-hydroxy-tetrahydrodipicolinate synthase [Alphaproteobacteria bacterium]